MTQCISLRVKWDETSQLVLDRTPECIDGIPLQVATMIRRMFVHVGNLAVPLCLCLPILRLEDTQTRTLFSALLKDMPFDGRSDMTAFAAFALIIYVCDGASTNRRICAWQTMTNANRTLVLPIYCLLHVLHNLSVPTLRIIGRPVEMFRASNVFKWSSFYMACCRSLISHVRSTLVIDRTNSPNPQTRLDNQRILEFLLCGGHTLETASHHMRRTFGRFLDVVGSDLRLGVITYFTVGKHADLSDEEIKCLVCAVLVRMVMKSIPRPTISRWASSCCIFW